MREGDKATRQQGNKATRQLVNRDRPVIAGTCGATANAARRTFAVLLLAGIATLWPTGGMAAALGGHVFGNSTAPASAGEIGGPAAGGTDEERFVVIKAHKIITITGKEIEDGVIVLVNGKVRSVGRGLEYPLNAKIIDAHDRVVMPGLINPDTRFGLPAYTRTEVHGDLSVADEYFPSPDEYDDLLDAGYTTLGLAPAGTGIPGRAIVVRTGGPREQRVLQSPAYLRVTADKKTFREALERAQQEIDKVAKARQEFDKKQEEQQKAAAAKPPPATQTAPATQPTTQPATQPAFEPPPIAPPLQALVDLIQKKPGLFALIEVNSAGEYVLMSDVLKKYDIAHRFVARNGSQSDLAYVAPKMGEKKTEVVMLPIISRVPASAERIHLVRMFSEAGCKVSLMPINDSVREHRRMLSRVAELVREGWSRDEALKAVTLRPAELLGLADKLGSIEKGKEADLIFLDADPLDPTAQVREVMIAGEIVHRVDGGDDKGTQAGTKARRHEGTEGMPNDGADELGEKGTEGGASPLRVGEGSN